MIPQSDLKDVAIRYQRAGLSILPIRADGSKAPALKTWEPLQKRLPTEDEIREWFGNGARRGVAVVCGAVSGGLYALDLDDLTIGEAFITELLAYDSELLFAMPQCRTPRPGKRLFFRYDGELHSTVLAYRVDADGRKREAIALIGDGKYSIVPPTPAECHENRKPYEWVRGDLTSVPTLSDEQLEDILALARLFDEAPKPEPAPLRVTGEAQRVGDRFNQEGDVLELLQRHGWRVAGNGREGNIYLTRPGKPRGVSASWHPQLGTLYVFTTNAPPFEAGRAYSPFAVYTLLEHGGDFSAAAKALAKQYGKGHRMEPERLAPPVDWAGFLRPLKEVEALPVDWLLPNLLARGEITILAGEAGAGKTTLALEIAHALTRDDTTLGERPQSQARVVWLHYDHSEGRIREKYEQTYGEEPEFMTPNMNKLEEAGMLRLTPDTVHLWASMLIAYGTECLIVDTLNDWLGCDDTDKESKVRPLMNALRQLVEKTGVAVLAIHHPNKASTLKRVTALANSYVFGAKADTVALLADPDGEPSATEVQLRVVKCRSGERWQATYAKHFGRFAPVQGEERPLTLQERIVQFVRTQGNCTRKQLLEAFGSEASEDTLDRLLKTLVRRGRLAEGRGGYKNSERTYAIPQVTIKLHTPACVVAIKVPQTIAETTEPTETTETTETAETTEPTSGVLETVKVPKVPKVPQGSAHSAETKDLPNSKPVTVESPPNSKAFTVEASNSKPVTVDDSESGSNSKAVTVDPEDDSDIPDYRTAVIPLRDGVAAWCDTCGCSMLHELTRDGHWRCVDCGSLRTFAKEVLNT